MAEAGEENESILSPVLEEEICRRERAAVKEVEERNTSSMVSDGNPEALGLQNSTESNQMEPLDVGRICGDAIVFDIPCCTSETSSIRRESEDTDVLPISLDVEVRKISHDALRIERDDVELSDASKTECKDVDVPTVFLDTPQTLALKIDHEDTDVLAISRDKLKTNETSNSRPKLGNSDVSAISRHSSQILTSSRKRDDMEVLKQKYINMEICDLPSNPVRQSRLHRSRSGWSLANKELRVELGNLRKRVNRFVSMVTDQERLKHSFRCSKAKVPTSASKPCPKRHVTDADYEKIVSEFEPGVVEVFRKFIEEQQKVNSLKRPKTSGSRNDQEDDGMGVLYPEADAKNAFMFGFLQGINHRVLKDDRYKVKREPSRNRAYRELIVSNQDITHRYLKQWERDYFTNASEKTPLVRHTSDIVNGNREANPNENVDAQHENKPGELKELKELPTAKSAINLGRIQLGMPVLQLPAPCARPIVHLVDITGKQRVSKPNTLTKQHLQQGAVTDEGDYIGGESDTPPKLQEQSKSKVEYLRKKYRLDASSTEEKENGFDGHGIYTFQQPEVQPELEIQDFSLDMSRKNMQLTKDESAQQTLTETPPVYTHVNKASRILPQATLPYSNLHFIDLFDNKPLSDEELSVVTKAKGYLDKKIMANLNTNKSVCERLNTSLTDSEQSLVKKAIQRRREMERTSPEKALDIRNLSGLDRWSIHNKLSDDIGNLHLSSSETLHPVEYTSPFTTQFVENESMDRQTGHDPNNHGNGLMADFGNLPHLNRRNSNTLLQRKTSFARLPGPFESPNSDVDGQSKSTSQSLSPITYPQATKAVKLPLTKASKEAKIPKKMADLCVKEKSLVNAPLSQCTHYNIEHQPKKTTSTASINMTDRLAVHLKNMSQGIVESRKSENADHVGGRIIQGLAESKRLKDCYVPSSKPSVRNVPDIMSGTQVSLAPTTTSLSKQSNVPLPDIPRKTSRGSTKLIPRMMDIASPGKLPEISVTPLPSKSRIKSEYASPETKYRYLCNHFLKRPSIPCRTSVCNSPFNFDREDPETLHLKARQLPLSHKVCTHCGGISFGKGKFDPDHDTFGDDKPMTGKLVSENGRVQSLNENMCDCKNGPDCVEGNIPRKKVEFEMPGKDSETNKASFEEMNLRFMDQDIKLKFQCEVSVQRCAFDGEQKKNIPWLENMASPRNRQCQLCPVATETRIYKDKNKQRHSHASKAADLRQLSDMHSWTPPPSPYLDYCKMKAAQRDQFDVQEMQDIDAVKAPINDLRDECYRTEDAKAGDIQPTEENFESLLNRMASFRSQFATLRNGTWKTDNQCPLCPKPSKSEVKTKKKKKQVKK